MTCGVGLDPTFPHEQARSDSDEDKLPFSRQKPQSYRGRPSALTGCQDQCYANMIRIEQQQMHTFHAGNMLMSAELYFSVSPIYLTSNDIPCPLIVSIYNAARNASAHHDEAASGALSF